MEGRFLNGICQAAFMVCLVLIFNSAGMAQNTNQSDRGQYSLGQQYEAIGDFDQALKIYLALLEKYPRNFTYFDAARKCYVSLKKYDELIQLIETRIELEPHNFQYQIRLGETYLQKEDKEKAFSIWNQMINKNNKNASVYRMVANTLIQNRLFDDGIEIYQNGRNTIGKQGLFSLELAQLHAYRFNYDKATGEYMRYLRSNPRQLSYVKARIVSFKGNNETYEQVTSTLKRWISSESENQDYQRLMISFLLSYENYNDAFSAVKKLEQLQNKSKEKGKTGSELFKFSQIVLAENQYNLAEKALNRILEEYSNYPDKARIEYELARTLYLQGKYKPALTAYDRVAMNYPKSIWAIEAILTSGDIYLDVLFLPDSAVHNFKKVLDNYAKYQNRIHTFIRLGDVEIARGNLSEAETFYLQAVNTPSGKNQRVKEKNNSKIEGQLKLAELAFYQGDFKKTRKHIENILKRPVSSSNAFVNDALELSIRLDNNEQNASEALKLYAEAILFKKQNKLDEASQNFSNVADSYPQAKIAPQARFQHSNLIRKTGDFLSAIMGFQALISKYPDNSLCDLALFEIGTIYENDLKDTSKAIENYETILVNYPMSMLVENVRKKIRSLEGNP
ncbi:tetratricopeptide repeat protein [candidate division KSB1 bacterium]|nr:tetratricopeptide repeat protein [candidate division KSB1 bacterium]